MLKTTKRASKLLLQWWRFVVYVDGRWRLKQRGKPRTTSRLVGRETLKVSKEKPSNNVEMKLKSVPS